MLMAPPFTERRFWTTEGSAKRPDPDAAQGCLELVVEGERSLG